MSTITRDLEPIRRGYPFDGAVTFVARAGESLPFPSLLTATRLRAEFRLDVNDDAPPLASLDSALDPQSLAATGAGQIAFALTGAQTALFAQKTISVDFACLIGGKWRVLPATFHWPVMQPVTRPPA